MNQGLDDSVRRLYDLLEARHGHDAQVRLTSLLWTLGYALDVGLTIADEAAAKMKLGRHMDDDRVRDATLSFQLTWECDQRSHFALESTIRYLHASGDILAQVVNDALDLGMGERDCSLSGVAIKLSGEPDHSRLAAALCRLRTSSEYRYVADGSNRTKHRNELYSNIWARVEDDGKVNVKQSLRAFEHDARSYDETEAAGIRSIVHAIRDQAGNALDELRAVLITSGVAGCCDE